MNLIQNNEFTTQDINLAINVFGENVDALKGKTTTSKLMPVVSNKTEIPNEIIDGQQDMTLLMDRLMVNL
jgi:hypothetical protein